MSGIFMAAQPKCAEGCVYATHIRDGASIHIRICMSCGDIDFDDIETQLISRQVVIDAARALCDHQPLGILNHSRDAAQIWTIERNNLWFDLREALKIHDQKAAS